MKICSFLFPVFFGFITSHAQDTLKYRLDLNAIRDDRLPVELAVPPLGQKNIVFAFPAIIPGTYRISDYGKFVHDVKAFDRTGKQLNIKKTGTNSWQISNADRLARITYLVEDIFDTGIEHNIYPMSATNFENENVVLHTPGIFGYIEGHNRLPFRLTIDKPARFYGSTALVPVSSTSTRDEFTVPNVDDLYESPIMYNVPDTTVIRVANTDVLISVYSPSKNIRSLHIADWLNELLAATADYLGGKLPADKYAFLYYFKDQSLKHSFPPGVMGALEHPTSSFYYLPDVPPQHLKGSITDISAHEFFHIITPLTIASREVKEFNYSRPVLSRHLWLYEGSTEYSAHHVQVKYGLKTTGQFLKTLSDKITSSKNNFNDTLSFTEMSRNAAGLHRDQFGNVYDKGTLITASLDLLLLHLSEGQYGFRNLTYDLGVRYGKDRAFEDEELFNEIGKLTWPEVREFLEKYVSGTTPIPYDEYFALAGFRYIPRSEKRIFTLGGFSPGLDSRGIFFIQPNSKFNEFGNRLGYKQGDEIYAFNGVRVTPQNFGKVADSIRKSMKEGDPVQVRIGRRGSSGAVDTLVLSAPAMPVTEIELHKIEPMAAISPQQEKVRTAWLTTRKIPEEIPADPADVASIDAIVTALYDVISGQPGPRNWQRFKSLFLPEALMGAAAMTAQGESIFHTMTPEDYKRNNAPFFMQSGFFEEEIGRKITRYGNIAIVESAFQYRLAPGGPVQQRGVNYYTLVRSKGRWWVANLSWQDETPGNPIPDSLLNQKS